MEYWEVPVNPMTRTRLTEDELDLGSIEHDPQRGEFLKFRDRFVAMKIAARLGARACPMAPGPSAPGSEVPANLDSGTATQPFVPGPSVSGPSVPGPSVPGPSVSGP